MLDLSLEADDENSSNEDESFQEHERLYDFSNQKTRRQGYYRRKRERNTKKGKPMPEVQGKTAYLRLVKADDCINDEVMRGISR